MIEQDMINQIDWRNINRSKDFNEAMCYFKLSDARTCDNLMILDEAGQEQVLQSLANKLYAFIVSKVYNIDFGEIPSSKGDFKKIPNYKLIVDCVNVLEQILESYKQPTTQIDTIKLAIDNIEQRKDLFTTAYRLNAEVPIVTYNTVALAIVSSLSLLITAHIEFIKQNDKDGYTIAFDTASKNKTKDKLLFINLEQFNRMCDSKELDKTIKYSLDNVTNLKYQENFGFSNSVSTDELQLINEGSITVGSLLSSVGGMLASGGIAAAKGIASGAGYLAGLVTAHPIVAGIVGFFAGVIALIKLLKWLIFEFYYERTKYSDKIDSLSSMMYMNALNLQNSLSKDDKSKEIVAKKQMALANFAKKLADTLRVDTASAEKQANKASEDFDKMKFTYDDVTSASDVPAPENVSTSSSYTSNSNSIF